MAGSLLIAAASIVLALVSFPERTGLILLQTLVIAVLGLGGIAWMTFNVRRLPRLGRASRARTARTVDDRLRLDHDNRVAAMIDECEPPPFEPDEAERAYVLNALRPGLVLLNLAAVRPAYEKHFRDGRIFHEIYFDRTGGNPTRAELAKLEAHKIARREWLERDPEFRAAVGRLREAGISYEFGGQGDYCGEFAVLRLRATAEALTRLERLAAEDAGFSTRAERAEAAERFRIFMLRNYADDWKKNREIYPDVGGSPYMDAGYWPASS